MFCQHCGKELPSNAKFCPNCGKATNGEISNTANNNTQPYQQEAYNIHFIKEDKPRSKYFAPILALSIIPLCGFIYCLFVLFGGSEYDITHGGESATFGWAVGTGLAFVFMVAYAFYTKDK